MPGGKVVINTGLLPITQTETAIVVCHEIVYAITKHGSERMNQPMMQHWGGMALQVA
jgi:predicted Zn-dependent protease